MKEMQRIIKAYAKLKNRNEPAVLATVVKTSGSTYRRPGARMLINSDGQMIGSVSGGCLERDVFRQARRVFQSGQPRLVTYDSTSEDDIVWGFGLGCNGVVDVLIERLCPQTAFGQLDFFDECLSRRRAGVIAKVFAVEGGANCGAGDFLIAKQDKQIESNIRDDELRTAVLCEALNAMATGESQVELLTASQGFAEIFIEVAQPPVRLAIFGAGHDAVPLARLAKEMGWQVIIIDGRPGYATKSKFPEADEIITARPEEIPVQVAFDSRTVSVVMNHNYFDDLGALRSLLPLSLAYVGLLGPKHRTRKLIDELKSEGAAIPDDFLAKLHGPAGMDIGADAPEEIALSIVAEIRAVLATRSGGFLKDRQGPIYQPPGEVELTGEKIKRQSRQDRLVCQSNAACARS